MNTINFSVKRVFAALVLSVLIVAGAASPLTISAAPNNTPRRYIVTFKENVSANQSGEVAESLGRANGFGVKHKYKKAIKGFSASMPAQKAEALKKDARVASVVEDQLVYEFAQTNPLGVKRVKALPNQNTNRGTGVGVAVLDSGIDLDHPDLKDNIVANKNCVDPTKNGDDDRGHGTHVAGTIAARKNTIGVVGVADQAKLIAVKVLNADGVGYRSQIICGIDWITENAALYNIKVVNLSIGGNGTSDNNCGLTDGDTYHQAFCRSAAAGLTYVVAAGNSGVNAQNTVPAAYDDTVITVSALVDTNGKPGKTGSSTSYGKDDAYASFSNYGAMVDIGAPGYNIYSTDKDGKYSYKSGTSMAAPHVAGAAAMFLKNNPTATWAQVRAGLLAKAETSSTKHYITSTHPEPVLWTTGL